MTTLLFIQEHDGNTEGLRSALARLRSRSGSPAQQPNNPSIRSGDESKSKSPSPQKSASKMAILEKRGSANIGQQGGSTTAGRGRASRRDSDLISTAASALRRLHFKAGKGSGVPKVMVMGSSTTSEATINTSTDSNQTAFTSVTVTTDADAPDEQPVNPAPSSLPPVPPSSEETKHFAESPTSDEEPAMSYSERSRELLNEFDLLFMENERRMENEERRRKQRRGALQDYRRHEAKRTGRQHRNGAGDSSAYLPQPCYCDNPSGYRAALPRRESVEEHRKSMLCVADAQAERRRGVKNEEIRGPSGYEEDHQKIQEGIHLKTGGSSSERESDELLNSSLDDHLRADAGKAPPPTPLLGELKREDFFSRSIMDEDAMRHLDAIAASGLSPPHRERRKAARSKSDRECPRSVRTIFSSDLPQRTFSTNFQKRRNDSSASPKSMTPRSGSVDQQQTRFPFPPPRGGDSVFASRCTTPLSGDGGGSSAPWIPSSASSDQKTEVAALTLSNVEKHDKDVLENADNKSSTLHINSALSDIDAISDNQLLASCRRRKRTDRKSISVETPLKILEADEKIAQNHSKPVEGYRDLILEEKISSIKERKYSVLASDGTIKNFVSETDRDFAKIAELANQRKPTNSQTRRQSAAPVQRHRRVSIVQGESMRHFIFEEPDIPPQRNTTSRGSKHRNRKVSTVIENVEDDFINSRKSSLVPGETLRSLLGDDFARSKASMAPGENARKFSINTLGDIVSARKFSLLPPGEIYTSQIDGKTTEIIKLKPGTKGRPLATIVVQQASFQRPSISGPSGGVGDDDLLDVTNAFTIEELHEFNMKYGSPHHARSQSVKTPGRSCGRPNYLCLPQQRSRVASMPNTGVEEEYYRLRHFSIAGKNVVNRGDSLKSRRSRSNNSVASSNSSTEHLATNMGTVGSHPGSTRTSAECSLASSRESSCTSVPYKVVMLGATGVGKTSLVSQFMTSEYLQACDNSLDEEYGEKSVSVLLDGEESELIFVDHPSGEMSPESCISTYSPQGYVVIYSVTDRQSVQQAEQILQSLWKLDTIHTKAVILVANKTDLVRSRQVTTEEGKNLARSYDCKFIETSVGINHHVDELLVGILTQIRLKQQQQFGPKKSKADEKNLRKNRNTRLTASLRGLKVKNLLGRVWARDSKSKSCENLHVL